MNKNTTRCIYEIQRIIADAWLHSTALHTFYDPDVQSDLKVVRRRYNRYITAAEDAHVGFLVVLLYSLLETRDDTANFSQLKKLLGKEGTDPDDIPRLTDTLKQAKELWIKVSVLRNKVIGHRSQNSSREDCFSEADLTPKNLMELTGLFRDAINAITLARNDHTLSLSCLDVKSELRDVLSRLAKNYDS